MIYTIDGPTASGKSTLAKELAKTLNIYYLNTGMLYRGLAYLLVSKLHYDENSIKNPQQSDLDFILDPTRFIYRYDSIAKLFFEDEEITNFLKTPEIDLYSSIVSANPDVRKKLLFFQREIAKNHDLVVEGRDTGSVVFPNAEIKIFLTASNLVRAERWQKDMEKKGKKYTFEESLKIISERDKRDKERKISPLIIPEDAIVIDSSELDIKELINRILNLGAN